MDLDSDSVHKHAKKDLPRPIFSYLDLMVNNPYLCLVLFEPLHLTQVSLPQLLHPQDGLVPHQRVLPTIISGYPENLTLNTLQEAWMLDFGLSNLGLSLDQVQLYPDKWVPAKSMLE